MAGLDPAIHAFLNAQQDVDARVKPAHDALRECAHKVIPDNAP
jgi:hypothetical protein